MGDGRLYNAVFADALALLYRMPDNTQGDAQLEMDGDRCRAAYGGGAHGLRVRGKFSPFVLGISGKADYNLRVFLSALFFSIRRL